MQAPEHERRTNSKLEDVFRQELCVWGTRTKPKSRMSGATRITPNKPLGKEKKGETRKTARRKNHDWEEWRLKSSTA